MKIVSQLDDFGYFVGDVEADESPLEPGVFLLPAGAVDYPPPDVAAGFKAKWTGSEFVIEQTPTPPPAPVPTSVTNAQGKAALILLGLDDDVEAAIAAITDPIQRKLALNDYNNRLTWERSNPRLQAIATGLGFDLDALFTLAAQQ